MVCVRPNPELPSASTSTQLPSPDSEEWQHLPNVSPSEILPISKSQPKVQKNRKHVKTRILTDTPEKQAIEIASEKNKTKKENAK